MKKFRFVVLLFAGLAILSLHPARTQATAGLAEWEIRTPGGNLISHIDPLIETQGTCLRAPEENAKPGESGIFADHLEWWQYYKGFVAGKAAKGFFLFDEAARTIRFFPEEAALKDARQPLGAPLKDRMGPAEGWQESWAPLYREQCQKFREGKLDFSKVPQNMKLEIAERTMKMCEELEKTPPEKNS